MEPLFQKQMPIYVDMDGTLVKTDIAQELLLQCFKKAGLLSRLMSVLFTGRSHIKRFLAENTEFSAERLPYNDDVIEYLKVEKSKGRPVILATASDYIIASKVADHLEFFDDILASKPDSNLKGVNKLSEIKAHSMDKGFEYIGDSRADYPIWKAADQSGFVNPPDNPAKIVPDLARRTLDIKYPANSYKALLKAMRPHQWAKNFLIFLPLFFSHTYFDTNELFATVLTFFLFSFCASGIYLINDLLDIEADRSHSSKKRRPFASGKLSPLKGVIASFFLILSSLTLCFYFLDIKVFAVLLIYIVITNLYSFYLKNYSTIDVITLTVLYTIRIIAGGMAAEIILSPWLINFSLFFFLSLAYMKRYIEISRHSQSGKLSGRNYLSDELGIIMMTGIVNGGISVFILTMYLNDNYVLETYLTPHLLWLICPLLLFWIYRAWMWAKRGKINDDPVIFAVKDKISLITAALIVLLFLFAKYIDFASTSI